MSTINVISKNLQIKSDLKKSVRFFSELTTGIFGFGLLNDQFFCNALLNMSYINSSSHRVMAVSPVLSWVG